MATGPNPPQPTRLERHAKVIGRSFMTRLRNYFLAGVLITAPITITVWLALQIIEFFDSTVRKIIPAAYNPEQYLPFGIPGLGRYFVQGALNRDYTLVMGVVIVRWLVGLRMAMK